MALARCGRAVSKPALNLHCHTATLPALTTDSLHLSRSGALFSCRRSPMILRHARLDGEHLRRGRELRRLITEAARRVAVAFGRNRRLERHDCSVRPRRAALVRILWPGEVEPVPS